MNQLGFDKSNLTGCTKAQYIFEKNQTDQELLRLRLIEEALDSTTVEHLQGTGVENGWRCLELGPGAGSILRWLADAVGSSGNVVGVDRSNEYLADVRDSRVQLLAGDFLELPVSGGFDLAHCRYVLIHNRDADRMVAKLVQLLRPGGWLVIEEPDFTSAKLLNVSDDASQQRVNNAICRMFKDKSLDPAYGLHLPEKLAREGVQIATVDSRLHLACGGTAMAQMMAASTRALADKYTATGEATQSDIQRYIENTDNDQFWAVYYSTVSVVATRRS